ncbi:hypothetical protein M8J75_005632 [Diaphorina citri]|nr:hypothetical protein M8J75_005632 [Diaphorina citri]
MYGVACQTDLLGDDLLLQVKKEEIPLKQKQRKSSRKKTMKTKAKKYSQMSDLSDEDYMDEDRDDREVADSGDNAEYVTTPMIKPDPDAESKPDRPKRKRIRLIHPCEYCPRKFRSQAEVKNHVLVKHLGKNPNHCLLCVKDFNSRNGLNIHLKTIHNVGYSDQKELVCNLLPDSEVKETVDPELLIQQQKILEDIDNLAQTELDEILDDGEVDVDAEDNVRMSDSGSDWAQDSDTPKKKKKSLPIPRPRPSRSRRKEKENLGARSNSKVVTVKYLSEDGIGEEKYVVKEENEEVKEKKEEMEEEKKPKTKAPRKRNRKPRIGERACMPLIHECPTCGKKWRTVSELNAHIQTHSDLRPFVCEICGQGYKMRKALLVHVGMHNGIHPFICHFCNKSFTQKVGLEKHINRHIVSPSVRS